MPLIVTEKPLSTAENLKLRLIHDSRYINGFLNKIPFSMERLKDFVKQLRTHDRLFAIDISSAYHHVMIAPRFQTLLGFTFEGVDYVYDTLCFGLSFSAYVFCRKTAVTANALRTSGLVTALINYCDDFIVPARMRAIVKFFLAFGWVLQPSKLVLTLGHALDGLGFTLNTARMDTPALHDVKPSYSMLSTQSCPIGLDRVPALSAALSAIFYPASSPLASLRGSGVAI